LAKIKNIGMTVTDQDYIRGKAESRLNP